MTRVALIEPHWAGGNWWGIVETDWVKQKGPAYPKLSVAYIERQPVVYHETHVPRLPVEHIVVTFQKMKQGDWVLWCAQVDGPTEAIRLLNIAYTCPDTHVHWDEARELRQRFENCLKNS